MQFQSRLKFKKKRLIMILPVFEQFLRQNEKIPFSLQIGTMLKLNYDQFTGTIQVMKAIGRHMVLTFCENLPRSQLFSVVLSRRGQELTADVSLIFSAQTNISNFIQSFLFLIVNFDIFSGFISGQELQSVRSMLGRRGLSTVSIRKVCSSGAESLTVSFIVLSIAAFLALLKH